MSTHNRIGVLLLIAATLPAWQNLRAADESMVESDTVIAERAAMHRLHAAVRSGHPDAIDAALASGVDINRTAALELAILSEQDEIVDLLIDRGADVNRPGLGGDLPLTVAVRRGRPALMQRLLERGADVDRRDQRGMTPLEHAQRQGRPETVELLRRHADRQRPATPR